MDCRVKNLWCSHHSSPHDPHVYHSYKANFQWCSWDVVGIHRYPQLSCRFYQHHSKPWQFKVPKQRPPAQFSKFKGVVAKWYHIDVFESWNHKQKLLCFNPCETHSSQLGAAHSKKKCRFSPPTDSWRLIPHSLVGDSWHDNFTICNLGRPFISSNMVVLDSFRDAKEGRLGIPVVGIHHLGVQWWVKTPYFSSTGAFWNQPITDSLGDSSHISLDGPSNPQQKKIPSGNLT